MINGSFNLDELYAAIPEALDAVMKNVEGNLDAMEVTPYWTGDTQESKKYEIKSKIAKLSYNTNYSEKIYTDISRKFSKWHNKNAQARWIEQPAIFEQALEDLADEMKKRGDKK